MFQNIFSVPACQPWRAVCPAAGQWQAPCVEVSVLPGQGSALPPSLSAPGWTRGSPGYHCGKRKK